jgi:hypothetical protein
MTRPRNMCLSGPSPHCRAVLCAADQKKLDTQRCGVGGAPFHTAEANMTKTKSVTACVTGLRFGDVADRCRAIFKQHGGEPTGNEGTVLMAPPQSDIEYDLPIANVEACKRALEKAGFEVMNDEEAAAMPNSPSKRLKEPASK